MLSPPIPDTAKRCFMYCGDDRCICGAREEAMEIIAMAKKPRADSAPLDHTSYTLTYLTATFKGVSVHDTPSDVRDHLDGLRAEGVQILSFTVSRGEEDDITGEFA